MKIQSSFKALFLFLFPLFIYANDGQSRKYTKEKTIKKEFKVNSGATLKVDNSYGNLNITTWNENRIVIEVHITTSGRDEEVVQRKLDNINVEFEASPNMVSAETLFNENDSGWFKNLFQDSSVSMDIDYLIKMPTTNNVDLSNDYGNIKLGRLEGRAIISCDYGKITTEELMSENNSLSFDYTDNSYFGYIKSAEINADYSGFTVGKAEKLNITADYTDSAVEEVGEVVFNCDYGNVEIKKADNVKGNGDYLTMRFGDIYGDIQLETDYGSIAINRMMEGAGDVLINSEYTSIDMGIQGGYNFKFSIELEYASLDAPGEFEFSRQTSDYGDKYYEGFYGNANSNNSIRIVSDYGNVEFGVE